MAKYNPNNEIVDGSIDAGLYVLSKISPPGVEWTVEEIAFVCGTTRQNIQAYEASAKRKLKREFERKGIEAGF